MADYNRRIEMVTYIVTGREKIYKGRRYDRSLFIKDEALFALDGIVCEQIMASSKVEAASKLEAMYPRRSFIRISAVPVDQEGEIGIDE